MSFGAEETPCYIGDKLFIEMRNAAGAWKALNKGATDDMDDLVERIILAIRRICCVNSTPTIGHKNGVLSSTDSYDFNELISLLFRARRVSGESP